VVGFENRLVLQEELLVNERLCGRRQAVLLEDRDLFVDEVTHLHTAQCGEAVDNGVADAGDVLLERLVPRVAVDAFEFDCFDKLLDVLVQRIRTLRLVVKAFLRELISDVVLDALAELFDDVLEMFAFGFVQLRLPLRSESSVIERNPVC